jgi:FlaA1/EpsC-like NDP-sugar epimerase
MEAHAVVELPLGEEAALRELAEAPESGESPFGGRRLLSRAGGSSRPSVGLAIFAMAALQTTALAAALAGVIAALIWLLVWLADQAPQALRVFGSGLSPELNLRVLVAVTIVLAAANDAGLFPLATIPILFALLAATFVARATNRLLSPHARVLIVGSGVVAQHVGRVLDGGRRADVVGYVDDQVYAPTGEPGASIVGTLRELPALVAEYNVDGVVFAFSSNATRGRAGVRRWGW